VGGAVRRRTTHEQEVKESLATGAEGRIRGVRNRVVVGRIFLQADGGACRKRSVCLVCGQMAGGCLLMTLLARRSRAQQQPACSCNGEPPSFWSSSPTPTAHRHLGPLHEPAPKSSEAPGMQQQGGSFLEPSWGAWRLQASEEMRRAAKVPGPAVVCEGRILDKASHARALRAGLTRPAWRPGGPSLGEVGFPGNFVLETGHGWAAGT
jgi:hypothetical protein